MYADSTYTSKSIEQLITDKRMDNRVCEKGYKNKTAKSKTRSRVEHIFSFMENSMNGMHLYQRGIERIRATVGLMNLTYNMFRKVQLTTTYA